MQCSRCGFENTDTKTYCNQCGTILHSFTSYSAQMNYNIQSAPPEYSSEYGMQPQEFSYQKLSSRPRITVLRVVRSIFYFIATFIAAFGLFGTFESFGNGSHMRGLGLFFMFGLIVAGVVLFLRMRRRITKLRWTQFILWVFGATGALFMAWLLEYAFNSNYSGILGSFIFWCIFMLYGLVLAAIALW